MAEAKASVTRMLDEHRNVVEALRDALLERQELIGDDILEVIRSSQPAGVDRTAATEDGGSGQPRSAQPLQRPRKTTSRDSTVIP